MLYQKFGVRILYEDNHLVFAVKPFGIPSQEDSSGDPDMLTIIKEYLKNKYEKPGNVFLGLVHRLDRPAGGVMVFARTSKAAGRLCEQIRTREVSKKYLAIVTGRGLNSSGHLEDYLSKDNDRNFVSVTNKESGKLAELEYNVLDERNGLTLVEVNLLTGRNHQIRVQFASRGFNLVGDEKYGANRNSEYNGIALWARSLTVAHPISREVLTLEALPPLLYPWSEFFVSEK